MNWATIKQKARDKVHKTFAVGALYTPVVELDNEGYTPVEILARFHQKTGYIGDEYSGDFSPSLLGQINRIIVDDSEVPNPQRGDEIRFPDYDNTVVTVLGTTRQGQGKIMCEVAAE